jgi:hypothetical protein
MNQILVSLTVPGWALEVANDSSTSTVLDELFDTDDEADAAFRETVAAEGMVTFLDSVAIVRFRR